MRGLKRRSFKLRERKENAFLLIISDKYGEEGESPSFVLARICKIFPVIDESLYATINSNLWPIPSDEFVNSIQVFGYLKISKLFNRDTNHFSYNGNKCKKAKLENGYLPKYKRFVTNFHAMIREILLLLKITYFVHSNTNGIK